MLRTVLIALIAVFLVLPLAADAKRPPLPLARADHAAKAHADQTVEAWAEMYHAPGFDYDENDTYITSYDLDPCDRISASRAECDVTYTLSDKSQCDSTIRVTTTRRDRLDVRDIDFVCDADD